MRKLLEKTLYTIGGFLTIGVVAFNVVCGSPSSSPKSTPPPTTRAPAGTELQGITSTPPPTLTLYNGLPFENITVKANRCTQIVTLKEFSRSPNPLREGWDIVQGTVRYHNMPDCDTTLVSSPWGHSTATIEQGNHILHYFLRTNLDGVWEGREPFKIADYGQLKKQDNGLTYDAVFVPFQFDVPKVVGDVRFLVSTLVGVIEGTRGSKDALKSNINKIQQKGDSSVNGRLQQVTDLGVYSKWFESQLRPYFLEELWSMGKNSPEYKGSSDYEVKVVNIERGGRGLAVTMEVRNITTTKDIELKGNFKVNYSLTADGDVPRWQTENKPTFNLIFDRSVLPPAYTSRGVLNITIPEDTPENARYIVGDITFLERSLYSKPTIINLNTIPLSPKQ